MKPPPGVRKALAVLELGRGLVLVVVGLRVVGAAAQLLAESHQDAPTPPPEGDPLPAPDPVAAMPDSGQTEWGTAGAQRAAAQGDAPAA